jgi:hypothetical protein
MGEQILDIANEAIGDLMLDSDLDACKLEVLRKAGIFDVTRLKALVIREFAEELLDKMPRL